MNQNQNNGSSNDMLSNSLMINPQMLAMMNMTPNMMNPNMMNPNMMNPNMMNPNLIMGMNGAAGAANANASGNSAGPAGAATAATPGNGAMPNLQQQQLHMRQLNQQMRQPPPPPQNLQQLPMFAGQFNAAAQQIRPQQGQQGQQQGQQGQQQQQQPQQPQQQPPPPTQGPDAQSHISPPIPHQILHPHNLGSNFIPVRVENGGPTMNGGQVANNGVNPLQAKTPSMVQGNSSHSSRHASVSHPIFQQKILLQQLQPFQQQQPDPQLQQLSQQPQQQQQAQFFPHQIGPQAPQQPQQQPSMQQHPQQLQLQLQPQQIGANPVVNLRKQISNFAIMKFLEFCEQTGIKLERDMGYWKKITEEYFNDTGTFRYSIRNATDSRQFEFRAALIPRFYYSIIQSGVTRFEFVPNAIKIQVLPNGTAYLESSRALMRHWHSDDSYLTIYGTVRAMFNQQLKIEWFDFQTHHFTPGLDWTTIEKLFKEGEGKDTFENAEALKKKVKVFSNMSQFGLQESVMRAMQVSDVMSHLKTLMLYSTTQECAGPLDALNSFVKQSNADGNQLMMLKKFEQQQLQQHLQQQQLLQKQLQQQQQKQKNQQFKSSQDLSPTSTAPEGLGHSENSPSPKTLQMTSPLKQGAMKTKNGNMPNGRGKDSDDSNSSKNELLILPKTPKLDLSQSTLTKRRRISHESDNGMNSNGNSNGRKISSSLKSPVLGRKKSNK